MVDSAVGLDSTITTQNMHQAQQEMPCFQDRDLHCQYKSGTKGIMAITTVEVVLLMKNFGVVDKWHMT